ncbi:MAG: hypothetical protein A2234_02535 [Elusimicrobia bacterium RIFOXYA2_FULL_58_8]|nr:MAG: hypothetical protein A2285_04185 [Elusimicrobia bacterium RIFOXYA12_FULL_57_11]OGS13183.1 MAG: hypothetical protein A2234_02535 [Elusimicrobia bacterium RIFOXYA2_FULL_58_8]
MNPAILIFSLALAVPSAAMAFPFSGASGKKAAEQLGAMRSVFAKGDCAAVQEIFTALELPGGPMREEAYGYAGQCYEKGGLTDKAINLYKLALGLYPENTFFAARLADIYNESGFYESAAILFLKILALRKDDVGANLGLARAYSRLGFLARAREFYSRTAALQNFAVPQVMREYAACLLKQRNWEAAAAVNAKGAAAEPGEAFWPLMSARTLAGQGKYLEAVSAMEAAVRLAPSRQRRLERAMYLLLGGRPALAIEAADAELAAGGSDPFAASVKALALYAMGEKKKAEPYFSAAAAGKTFTGKLAAAFLAAGGNGGQSACKK